MKRNAKPTVIAVAELDITCAACGELIPQGERYWIRTASGRGEHTNCELYSTDYIKKQIIQEKVNGSR